MIFKNHKNKPSFRFFRPRKRFVWGGLFSLALCVSQGMANTVYNIMPSRPNFAAVSGLENERLLNMASSYVHNGQIYAAQDILAHMKPNTAIETAELHILRAQIALALQKPRLAIDTLSAIRDPERFPTPIQVQYHNLLAQAYERNTQQVYALQKRLKLEMLLDDPRAKQANRRKLWLGLMSMKSAELNALVLESDNDTQLQGWLKLAQIAREKLSGQALYDNLILWQQAHPNHPANTLMPASLDKALPYLRPMPKVLALLLPISGALAGPASAIQDGFLAAYQADGAPRQVQVKVYDTSKADIKQIYQQAIEAGANYIVGPLAKPDVAAIAALDHPVPTLLLNDIDVPMHDYNVFRFGLSPLNEARQTAVKASLSGLHRALVIAPADAWGAGITAAFQDEWQKNGGVIVDRLVYGDSSDLNTAVRELLHVSQRQAAQKQYRISYKGHPATNGPKRRQDFDMIFLLAYPSKARQIMPLLKYYFAGDVPVYSTSLAYAGNTNTMRDRDLEGLIFCDMPWMFRRQGVAKNWAEQFNSYNRLYALGMDSYALATQLNQLMIFPAISLNDDTGVLYLNRFGQVARVLSWGRFQGGLAHLVSEAG